MAKLRFGVCGLGCMGRGHFARLQKHPQAEVVAVCDTDEGRRNGDWNDELGNLDLITTESGRVPLDGIASYAKTDDLIADANVDAVMIALPTILHAEVAAAAMEAGKHVLCEKPMAYRVGDCDRMMRAAETSGRTLMIAQCLRFWPEYEAIKRCVDEGRIGRVQYLAMRRLGSTPTYSAGGWLLDGRQSGGAILDLHVHDIDFAQHLLGLPTTIHAHGTPTETDGIDHVIAAYGYADQSYALIEGGWFEAASWPFQMSIAVHGDKGSVEWGMTEGNKVLLHMRGSDKPEVVEARGDAYEREVDYFIRCVLGGESVDRCLPQSTRTSVALAWLERRSIETGRVIPVSERLREVWSE